MLFSVYMLGLRERHFLQGAGQTMGAAQLPRPLVGSCRGEMSSESQMTDCQMTMNMMENDIYKCIYIYMCVCVCTYIYIYIHMSYVYIYIYEQINTDFG